MSQYKIIGGDGKEYGPISFDQVQNWIREGRANTQTMIRTDTNPKWIPLGQCPEFASMVGGPPVINPNINQPIAGHGMAMPHNPNAKSKLVAGILGIVPFIGGLGIHRFYLGYVGIGIAQIFVTLISPCFCPGLPVGFLWGFIEGIMILIGSGITTDAAGIPLKD